MYTEMGMGGEQRQEMRISPSLIQYTRILQLSGQELRDLIMQELDENPALKLEERTLCPACGDPLRPDGRCYRCGRGERLAEVALGELGELEDPDEAYEALMAIPDQASLEEYLLHELGAVLGRGDLPIVEYLIGELDERGFLDSPLSLVAGSLGRSLDDVERVLRALQTVGPLGIGARSVQECLLIQLERLEEELGPLDLVRALIADHLEDLGAGRYAQLARQLGVTPEEVVAARDLIRAHLRPFPIAEATDLAVWERGASRAVAMPDVIIRASGEEGGGYTIEVPESKRFQLSVNPVYDDLAQRLVGPEADARAGRGISSRDRRHVQEQVRRAQSFVGFIRERRDTLERVTALVAAHQEGYLREGSRLLLPLTRAEVATALGLHESTISRATKDKFVMLPNRHVVPFSTFFHASLSVKEALRMLVEKEARPLTDIELAERLAALGQPISRRTVTKYRQQMGILPSHLR